MSQFFRIIAFALIAQSVFSATAPIASAQQQRQREEPKPWGMRFGMGFTDDPDAFLTNLEIERFVRDEVAVGFALQFGVDDDFVIVSPHVFTRYVFDLTRFEDTTLKKMQPFLQAGLGVTHIEIERSGNDRDGTDVLLNFGGGLDFALDDAMGIGSRALINIIPGEVLNQRIYFSWEVVSFRYRW